MLTWIILAAIIIFCIIVHPLQKAYGLTWNKKDTKWGNFEIFATIEAYDSRDFDLTLSLHPQYFSFQLSLWFVAFGVLWHMYDTHLDCERDHNKDINDIEKNNI